MEEIKPDYFDSFACIASHCRHNCCIGWEIDIDEDTLCFYESLDKPFKEELEKNIVKNDGCVSFKLTENERCPFLLQNNLCKIISTYGNGALCSICAEHPRFYNYFSGTMRSGLGLCCEEAARIIVLKKEKTTFSRFSLFTQEEKQGFALLQNRKETVRNRLCGLLRFFKTDFPGKIKENIFEILLSLERLDEAWTTVLEKAKEKESKFDLCGKFENEFEQLAVYFFYRHFSALCESYDEQTAARFVCFCTFSLMELCAVRQRLTQADIVELARAFSGEVEYSDENVDAICSFLL